MKSGMPKDNDDDRTPKTETPKMRPKRRKNSSAANKKAAAAAKAATIGRGGEAPPSEALAAGDTFSGLRVVPETATDEQHELRRKKLLHEAATARTTAENETLHAEKLRWEDEAKRLRGLAGSALAHAEADANDAGYTSNIQSIGSNGRMYLCGTNPRTSDRLAWGAGVYTSRHRSDQQAPDKQNDD